MSDQFLAEIRLFAGNFAPRGWATTNGQILSLAQNTAVFSLLGTNFGGNGTSNFALPNFQGSIPVGSGQGVGLTQRVIGETMGSPTVTLLTSELPAHHHVPLCDSDPADQPSPGGQIWAVEPVGATNPYHSFNANNPPPLAAMNSALIDFTGGNQPHNNLQPCLVLTFIIALQGIFPARS